MKNYTKDSELNSFADLLKENGFTVILTEESKYSGLPTWFQFEKNGKIGYVQKSYYYGYDFSTVHKPSKENGTGFSVLQQVDLSIENAEKTLVKPSEFVKNKVQYYKDASEFITSPINQIQKHYIL